MLLSLGYMFLFGCLILIGMGFYGLKRGSTSWWRNSLRKGLTTWQVFGTISPEPQTVTNIEKSWCYLFSVAAIGAGIGTLVVAIAIIVTSLITVGVIDQSLLTSGLPIASFYCGACVGGGLGAIYAVWHLRATSSQHVAYTDLQQRQLSNYRSSVLRWIPLALIAWVIALTVFFVPYLGRNLQFLQPDDTIIHVSNGIWLRSIMPAIMLLVFIVAEVLMARISMLSRLLVAPDPLVSRRVDDMMRATVIGLVQCFEFAAIGYLGYAQQGILENSLTGMHAATHQHNNNWLFNLLLLTLFLTLMVSVLGFIAQAMQGRLGGKVSGWPWQPKAAV